MVQRQAEVPKKQPERRQRLSLSLKKFTDWEVGEDYEIEKILGEGSYSQVAQAVHKPTGTKVAIKQMNKVFKVQTHCKRILREIHLLSKLSHPSVVKIFDLIQPANPKTFNTVYLVLVLGESDLKKLIKSSLFLDRNQIQHLVYNLLCGLKYLHSAMIVHRDLKPANVLIFSDCTVQIADFSLSRSLYGVQKKQLIQLSNEMRATPTTSQQK